VIAWVTRDLMLPVLWAQAWIGNTVSWRGNEMKLADAVAGN
jgi:ceramide glucosyltransferase